MRTAMTTAIWPPKSTYDRRRDARYQIPAEKQRLNETYGPAKFYGWSEDKARQVSVRERALNWPRFQGQGFNLDLGNGQAAKSSPLRARSIRATVSATP